MVFSPSRPAEGSNSFMSPCITVYHDGIGSESPRRFGKFYPKVVEAVARTLHVMPKVAPCLRPQWADIPNQRFSQTIKSLSSVQDLARFWDLPVKQLNYHAYHATDASEYHNFSITRRNGRKRKISAPNRSLKYIQRIIHETLSKLYWPDTTVHGFVSQRSTITNAKTHLARKYVLNADLKDFFQTITRPRIIARLKVAPYELQPPVAVLIGFLATDGDGQLPQGSPCSPVIANIMAASMDTQLKELCKKLRCTYTRYADDLTISTDCEPFPPEIARYPSAAGTVQVVLGDSFLDIIENNGFQINHMKSRLQNHWTRQICTGLVVNREKLSLPRSYKRRLRALIHNWKSLGWEKAAKRMHEKEYRPLFHNRDRFVHHVYGRINYMRMIYGVDYIGAKKLLSALEEIPKDQ
ncbi:MAG: RNA-directed DNA polymerase [Rhodothermaceae bacterium]|nr:RNA-directed DNA polymerase [Rhodothermaceae bacterium]